MFFFLSPVPLRSPEKKKWFLVTYPEPWYTGLRLAGSGCQGTCGASRPLCCCQWFLSMVLEQETWQMWQLVGQAVHHNFIWPLPLSSWAEPWQSMSSTALCVDVSGAVFDWLVSFHLAFGSAGHLWPWVMDIFLPTAHGLSFVKYLLHFWRTM